MRRGKRQRSNSCTDTIPPLKIASTQLLCPLGSCLTICGYQPAKHSKIQCIHVLKWYRFSFVWLKGAGGEVKKLVFGAGLTPLPYRLVCLHTGGYCFTTASKGRCSNSSLSIREQYLRVLTLRTLHQIKMLSEAIISMPLSSV